MPADLPDEDDDWPATDVTFPDYEGRCFANVPGTIGSVFDVDLGRSIAADLPDGEFDHVIFLLLDGLGLYRFRRDSPEVPLLRRLAEPGRTRPLTATFPSATASAIATIHTGRTPAEHGVIGGTLYLRDCGTILETLGFARRDGPPESGVDADLGTSVLNSGPTVYERLAAAGVESNVIQPTPTTSGTYAEAMLRGSRVLGYEDTTEAARLLRTVGEQSETPTYTYCYLPHVDHLSHHHGPDSDAYRDGLESACADVEAGLDAIRASEHGPEPERTLVLLAADHGHVPASPSVMTDLTADSVIREALVREDGDVVRPTGGPRSAFLHLRDGHVDRVYDHLSERYDGRVFHRERALDELELFGPNPTERARERCGDLIYVPAEGGAWFGDVLSEKRGLHGGLSPKEMLVPFVATRLSAL